jgi:hypothetical protein
LKIGGIPSILAIILNIALSIEHLAANGFGFENI